MYLEISEFYELRRYQNLIVECLSHVTSDMGRQHYLIADPLEKKRVKDFYYKSDDIHYESPNFSHDLGGHIENRFGTRWISGDAATPLPSTNRQAASRLSQQL